MGVRVRYLARCAACVALTLSVTTTASAAEDPIIEWNRHAFAAFRVGSGTPAAPVPVTPLVTSRVAAIVQAAMFDAVNGVERRYSEIHVVPNAPRGASKRAAAIEAAHRALVTLFPGQQTDLDEKLTASLTALTSSDTARTWSRASSAATFTDAVRPEAQRHCDVHVRK